MKKLNPNNLNGTYLHFSAISLTDFQLYNPACFSDLRIIYYQTLKKLENNGKPAQSKPALCSVKTPDYTIHSHSTQ